MYNINDMELSVVRLYSYNPCGGAQLLYMDKLVTFPVGVPSCCFQPVLRE